MLTRRQFIQYTSAVLVGCGNEDMSQGFSQSDPGTYVGGDITIDPVPPPIGGGLIPSIVASQTSGRSPLGVVFSCDKTISPDYDEHEIWRLFGYSFDFDDPTSGTYNTIRGGDKNTQVGGPMACHTFIVPDGGGTVQFDVLVNIEAPDGSVGQASVTITVEAQDSFYAAADTLLISDSLDTTVDWSTLGFDKSPPSVPEANRRNVPPAWNELDGKRVMWQRGSTFNPYLQTIEYGQANIAFTDFGNDADGRAELQRLYIGTSADSFNSTFADDDDFNNKYGGVWIESVSVDSLRLLGAWSGMACMNITMHDLDMDAEGSTDDGWSQWNRRQDYCLDPASNLTPSNVPITNGLVWSDVVLIGSFSGASASTLGNQFFVSGPLNWFGMTGCSLRNAGEHNIRSHGVSRAVIHNTDALGNHLGIGATGKQCITMRGTGYKQVGDWQGMDMSIGGIKQYLILKPNQNETTFDNNPTTSGTFDGGLGHVVGNVITVDEGATVLVNAVDGSGTVTQFDVDETTDAPPGVGHVLNVTLSQVSSTGPGTGFLLNVEKANVSNGANFPALSLQLVQGCYMTHGTQGSPGSWELGFMPSANTELQLLNDCIERDNEYVESIMSGTSNVVYAGRWMTVGTDDIGYGGPPFDKGPSQELTEIDLGSGTPSLVPGYPNQPAIPVPTAPR